jgi:putative ABC transport system permease protein
MIGVALKGLLGRKLRAVLTAFAIVLGVAMISGSFVLTDTLGKTIDGVYEESYAEADAVVSSKNALTNEEGDEETAPFSAGVLGQMQELPGVRVAEGEITDVVTLLDRKGEPIGNADTGNGVSVDAAAGTSLSPVKLASGEWPRADGEIAIDKATADEQKLAVGDSIGAFADGPAESYRITGTVRFGELDSLAGTTIAVFDRPTAERLFDKQGQLDLIRVAAKPGVSEAELVGQIEPLLTETIEVQTATAQAASDSQESQDGMGIFRTILLAFGGIALFVGSFVIANTLSITVAQRMRELATLRTLGASRKQVLGSVVLESVVVGAIASVVGLFAGLGIAKLLYALLAATGIDLPDEGLVLAPRTVIVSLVVGTLIALLASLRPAFRATRVAPIAAVREGAVMPTSRFARYALPVSLVVTAAAVALFSYGAFASGLETKVRLFSLAGGVLLLFVGVAMIAPRVVRPLASVLGAPGARLGGSAGQLARENAMRNPSRTASTAAAIMIGISLITFVAVLGQGLRSSFTDAVDELFVADYNVSGGTESALSSKAATAVSTAPGVEVVSEIRDGQAKTAAGKTVQVSGVDGNLTKVVNMEWSSGSDSVPAQLGTDGAFVTKPYADDHSLTLGSPVTLKTPTGKVLSLRVEGVFDEPKGGSPFGEVSVSTTAFDGAFADHGNAFTLANVTGEPSDEATAGLEQAVSAFPTADVQTRDEFKSAQLGELTMTLNVLYALLGLSVIVSLLGVVNTLVLSVFERTRELGMLRAIGMTRRQVRRMIRHESIVTALIGAALGIGLGVFLAALATRALSDYGMVFSVPLGALTVFVVIAIAAGMLAAILPARRASRLNVLKALQYE